MPITRITLGQDYSEARLQQISALLHQTLVAEFAVPVDDCFQLIELLPASQRIYNRYYLSEGRSEDFILFQITAGRPRSRQQKQRFYQQLCASLHSTLGIDPGDVMVIIQFNSSEEWSFSGGRMLAEVMS
ncbi:tautomerase family protein [Pantoea sp.]|uniref:tautomerase family protein n=1 Tax=Pantoea sp. TaxID=69393 RepID=UPI0029067BF6|nr:tautomerase family protein [Pantoea sp.]MDU4127662.1 tautomerase family protein [Pantoea sp.]